MLEGSNLMEDGMNSKISLAILVLVVAASGCAPTGGNGDTGAASTQAVQVANFSAVPDTVFDNQGNINLRMSVLNTGDAEATGVHAEIFNIPMGVRNNRQWEVSSPFFNFSKVRGADEGAGIPATPIQRTKSITPPNLNDGETIPYDIMAQLRFNYSNTASTEIQITDQDRFRENAQSRSRPAVENSDGPIQMEVRTRTPIVTYSGGSTSSNFCVILRNEGNGNVYNPDGHPDPSEQQEGQLRLSIDSTSTIDFDPTSQSVGTQSHKVVDMVGNRAINCYEITGFQDATDIQKTIPVTLEAEYGYRKEAQTSVTVRGRPDN